RDDPVPRAIPGRRGEMELPRCAPRAARDDDAGGNGGVDGGNRTRIKPEVISVSTQRRRDAEPIAISAQRHRDTENIFLESGVNFALRAIGPHNSAQNRASARKGLCFARSCWSDDGRNAAIEVDGESLRVLRGEGFFVVPGLAAKRPSKL